MWRMAIFGDGRKVMNKSIVHLWIVYLHLCCPLLSLYLQIILLHLSQDFVDLFQWFWIYDSLLQAPENLQFFIRKEKAAIEVRNTSHIVTHIGVDRAEQLKTDIFNLLQILALFLFGTGKRISSTLTPSFTVRQTSPRKTIITAFNRLPYVVWFKWKQFDFSVWFDKDAIRSEVELQIFQSPLFIQKCSCD